ncbi:MAG: hypothetical protein A2287_04385 [Candidatus Melainabacteria bacterium RIFOXYA12_FULL_32_12]|nr:MAG: hypothetical protein A2287_04385 [Candidatus Melainabacteria bacterium RIFOXYA12_FULL_32_12]
MCSLPENWALTKFDEVVTFITDYQANGSFATLKENVKYYNAENYAVLVRLKDLRHNMTKIEDFVYTDKHGYNFLKKSSLRGGEILVANVGSVGTTILMPHTRRLSTLAPNMFIIFISDLIDKDYFVKYSQSHYYWNEISRVSGGSSQPKMNKKEYRDIEFPLAPINEQKRIVAKLEKLLAKVETSQERLNKIPPILKRFRQSVLMQACSGELTKKWREQNPDVEPAEELLKNIEEEITALVKSKKIQKENIPVIPETAKNGYVFPETWLPLKARYLCHHITKGTTPKTDELTDQGDIPYLKVYNIVNNKIDFEYKPQFVSKKIHEGFLGRSKVYPNDVLMNIVGPPLGKIAIVPDKYPEWNINQALAIFRPIKYLLPEFLYIVLSYDKTLYSVLPETKGIVGQSNISLEQCRDLIIPLPSLKEQQEIIKKVNELYKIADRIEARYLKAKKYTDRLAQSILAKAFRGELVSQDPNDEPASVLLEHIREEKVHTSSRKKVKVKV